MEENNDYQTDGTYASAGTVTIATPQGKAVWSYSSTHRYEADEDGVCNEVIEIDTKTKNDFAKAVEADMLEGKPVSTMLEDSGIGCHKFMERSDKGFVLADEDGDETVCTRK